MNNKQSKLIREQLTEGSRGIQRLRRKGRGIIKRLSTVKDPKTGQRTARGPEIESVSTDVRGSLPIERKRAEGAARIARQTGGAAGVRKWLAQISDDEDLKKIRHYESIGESIWNTYEDMAYIISEITSEYVRKAAKSVKGRWSREMTTTDNPYAMKHYGDAHDKQKELLARLAKRPRVRATADPADKG